MGKVGNTKEREAIIIDNFYSGQNKDRETIIQNDVRIMFIGTSLVG